MALFINPENQKLLWGVLHKNALINQIFPNRLSHQKEQWFKTVIETFYNNNRTRNLSIPELQKLNQDVLGYMVKQLRDHISTNEQRAEKSRPIHIQERPQTIQTPELPINKRQELFTDQFNQRQKEYENMFEKKVPDAINFSDNIEDGPITNMEQLILEQKRMRENELKQFSPPLTANETKIQIDNHSDNITIDVSEIDQVKMKKNVSWAPDEIDVLKQIVLDLSQKVTDLVKEMLELKTQINEKREPI